MTEPTHREDNFTLGLKRSSLEGRIIFACPHCQAPGVYSDHLSIMQGWPGCYDPTRLQQPVGDICPNCERTRSPDLNRGELQASIPLWLWKTILGLKRLAIGTVRLKRAVLG